MNQLLPAIFSKKNIMRSLILKALFILIVFSPKAFSLFAQNHFNLTIELPQRVNKEKVEVWLDNGKRVEKIKTPSITEGQFVLTGEYYSLYARIRLQYQQEQTTKVFGNTFFVQEKPGIILFYTSDLTNSPFNNYSLKNVWDFKEEKNQMDNYDSAERKKAMEYEAQYGDKIFTGSDTAIRRYYFQVLAKAFRKKELEYIIRYPNSYYSFYIFRTDIAWPGILSPDSLLLVFNAFPDKFKYSDEGNYLHEFILGKLSLKKIDNAIDFTVKDIHRKNITLSQFKGKKYVLLHFWATWCTPCIKELPAIKGIHNRYKYRDLQIISVALKSSNDADYMKAIKKYQMDWIHIYNDLDLLNKYGNQPIPRICIIDKSGKVVYDNIGLGKNEDFQLSQLNQFLKKTIN